MPKTNIDELLKRIVEVAEAVNLFKSEAIQQKVFDLLMRASNVEADFNSNPQAEQNKQSNSEQTIDTSSPKSPGRKSGAKPSRGSNRKLGLVTELNLRPSGKKSLKNFVEEKGPNTNEERFAVIVHYLQHELSEKNINQNHIYTAFKELNVKVPIDIYDALTKSAQRKGWIETKDMANIMVTTRGENFVEHDLPHGPDNK